MTKWISVKDKLPSGYEFCLVYSHLEGTNEPCPISIARWEWEAWKCLEGEAGACACGDLFWSIEPNLITHWMPLPEPPQKEPENIQIKEYEKIITFDEPVYIDEYREQLLMYSQMLINSMFENKKIPEYFLIRTRDSLRCMNTKDMVLTWTTDEA